MMMSRECHIDTTKWHVSVTRLSYKLYTIVCLPILNDAQHDVDCNDMDHAYSNNFQECPIHHRHGPLRDYVKS